MSALRALSGDGTLSDVSPSFAFHYVEDRRSVYPKSISETVLIESPLSPDLSYQLLGELALPVAAPPQCDPRGTHGSAFHYSFLSGVRHVVSVRTLEKMAIVETSGSVTGMANLPCRPVSVRKEKGDAVNPFLMSFVLDPSIAPACHAERPEQTSIRSMAGERIPQPCKVRPFYLSHLPREAATASCRPQGPNHIRSRHGDFFPAITTASPSCTDGSTPRALDHCESPEALPRNVHEGSHWGEILA